MFNNYSRNRKITIIEKKKELANSMTGTKKNSKLELDIEKL